jgi:hypothetical protein
LRGCTLIVGHARGIQHAVYVRLRPACSCLRQREKARDLPKVSASQLITTVLYPQTWSKNGCQGSLPSDSVRRLTRRRDGAAKPTSAAALTFASVAVSRSIGTLTVTQSGRILVHDSENIVGFAYERHSTSSSDGEVFLAQDQSSSNAWQLHCICHRGEFRKAVRGEGHGW